MATAENLLLPSWKNLDSNELRLLLNEKIGGTGQVDGGISESVPFYLPMAGDTCQIVIKYKNKKINSLLPGKAFDAGRWAEASSLINGLVDGGQKRVGRQIGFSAKRVSGNWRGANSNIQICAPPANAPLPNELIAENPFVLEFPFVQSGISRIDNYRLGREHCRYCRVLNVILFSHIQFHGIRQKKFWAQLWPKDGQPDSVEYRWVQNGYFVDIGEVVAEGHSSPSDPLAMVFSSSVYYLPQTFHGDYLTVPDNLDSLLCNYQSLTLENKEKFDRAAYWFDIAYRQWEISASASYFSLVAAIEALSGKVESDKVKCDQCGIEYKPIASGAIRAFKDFLEKYAQGTGLNGQRNKMYSLRSNIAHGSGLLLLDNEYYFGWDPVSERERDLQWELWRVTKMAMLNWLKASSSSQGGIGGDATSPPAPHSGPLAP